MPRGEYKRCIVYGCKKQVVEDGECRDHYNARKRQRMIDDVVNSKKRVIEAAINWEMDWSEEANELLHAAVQYLLIARRYLAEFDAANTKEHRV